MSTNLIKNEANNLSKLNYSVLVEAKNDGYQATVWGLPDCQVFAATKEDALYNLQELVNKRLKKYRNSYSRNRNLYIRTSLDEICWNV
ncbi:type II toxin-antitoxin system HicB family antitoxin [Nostoc piscinale]|uniref:type II toxin-antitoxin system HicB family antitoxin n=1 Tax=Nostoc piscinale TaxID=224012 RepID=UPI000A4A0EA8|nr:hypothetical protein [Nostoc piscinale]